VASDKEDTLVDDAFIGCQLNSRFEFVGRHQFLPRRVGTKARWWFIMKLTALLARPHAS
jgi:hypothetical protein